MDWSLLPADVDIVPCGFVQASAQHFLDSHLLRSVQNPDHVEDRVLIRSGCRRADLHRQLAVPVLIACCEHQSTRLIHAPFGDRINRLLGGPLHATAQRRWPGVFQWLSQIPSTTLAELPGGTAKR